MTRTDDVLVRELADLTDRALPPLALEPAAVLDAGRRHRRRRTLVQGSAGLAAVAVAAVVVATQLGTGPAPVAAPPAQTVQLVEGLVAAVPTSPTALRTPLGPGVDLGLPADDEHRYVVVSDGSRLELRRADADGAVAGEPWDLGYSISYPSFWMVVDGGSAVVYGQGGPDIEVTLVCTPADGSAPVAVPVPTATVEGFFGALYMLRIDGAPVDGAWPDLAVEVRSPDGSVTTQPITLPAQPPPDPTEVQVGVEVGDLTVRMATTATPLRTDAGVVFDPGLTAGAAPGRIDTPMPVLVTAGSGVDLRTLGTDGLGDVLVHVAAATGGVSSGGSSWDGHALWALESVEAGTDVTLLVDGTAQGVVPTFTVSGLAGQFVLVQVEGPGDDLASWPEVALEFHRPSGTTDITDLTGSRSL